MTTYVALLRGINSGKNPTIKMAELKQLFEQQGCENVSTIMATGNVVFSLEAGISNFESRLETTFHERFGFYSAVTIRSHKEISDLISSQPFAHIELGDSKAGYVTFLPSEPAPETVASLPKAGNGYHIVAIQHREVFSMVDLTQAKTPDLMRVLDKYLGKEVTTRRWHSVEQILERMEEMQA